MVLGGGGAVGLGAVTEVGGGSVWVGGGVSVWEAARAGSRAARRSAWSWRLRARASARRRAAIWGQASSQRSAQTTVRSASIGSTLAGAQCIPLPLSRSSTTTLLALSTMPLPIG